MSWSFDPSAWVNGVTIPTVTNFQSIATDLHTRGATVDGGAYGRANTGFLTLIPGSLPGTTYTVTGASWTTGTATLTIGAHAIFAGQLITSASIVPSGYNGSFLLVTGVTGTTISYAVSSNPGAYSSGGTVIVGGVSAANGMLAVDQNGALNRYYSGSFSPVGGGTGTVTHTGSLTSGKLVVGNGGADITLLSALSWTAPTLLNSWANDGGGWAAAGYLIDPFGFVHIRGVITGGTVSASTAIFVLPAGFRPLAMEIFPIGILSGSTSQPPSIFVDASGNVAVLNGWSGLTTVALAATFSTF